MSSSVLGRLVAAHDGVLRGRPGEDEARVERLAAQGVVAGAERAADDQRDLRHDAVGDRVDQLRPGLDDAGLLGVAADHEAVDVLEEEDRHARLVAVHDEARGLVGGIDVDDAAELQRARRPACTRLRWLATTPTGTPPSRPKPHTSVWPYSALYSSNGAVVEDAA